ncbi:hypothetical protein BRL53_04780 [Corynebacterium ulcerans]|nr:hypothetical protein BRL53_04780 [Corynebacterium ulcerans]
MQFSLLEKHQARALAVVAAGLSGAMSIGGPIGTLLGQKFGWKISFVFFSFWYWADSANLLFSA